MVVKKTGLSYQTKIPIQQPENLQLNSGMATLRSRGERQVVECQAP